MKFVVVLVVGLACGYYLGYKDGSSGNPSPVARVVNHIGKSKGAISNDIDAQMQKAESTKPPGPKPEPKK